MKASRRDIAAAVAAEIGRGPMWQAVVSYELYGPSLRAPLKDHEKSLVYYAHYQGVQVADLERVIRGRRYIRGLK